MKVLGHMRKEDLPAIPTNRWIQIHGMSRIQHVENVFWWVFVIVAAIGLCLKEESIREWAWAAKLNESARLYLPAVDIFWRVSTFPAITQFLTAIAWMIALAFGPIAVLTVRHLRFPGMYAPAGTRYWVGLLGAAGFIALMGWNPAVLTPEKLTRTALPWSFLNYAAQNQVAFSLLAGVIAGLVAVCWSGLCIIAVKRFLASR